MKPDALIGVVVVLCLLIAMAVWPVAYLTAAARCPRRAVSPFAGPGYYAGVKRPLRRRGPGR